MSRHLCSSPTKSVLTSRPALHSFEIFLWHTERKDELTQCVANFFPNQSTHISCTCKRNFSNLCRLNVISASNNKSFDQKWVLFQSLSPQFNRNLIFTENTKCTQHVGICFGCKNLETLLKITLNHEIPNRKPRIN